MLIFFYLIHELLKFSSRRPGVMMAYMHWQSTGGAGDCQVPTSRTGGRKASRQSSRHALLHDCCEKGRYESAPPFFAAGRSTTGPTRARQARGADACSCVTGCCCLVEDNVGFCNSFILFWAELLSNGSSNVWHLLKRRTKKQEAKPPPDQVSRRTIALVGNWELGKKSWSARRVENVRANEQGTWIALFWKMAEK